MFSYIKHLQIHPRYVSFYPLISHLWTGLLVHQQQTKGLWPMNLWNSGQWSCLSKDSKEHPCKCRLGTSRIWACAETHQSRKAPHSLHLYWCYHSQIMNVIISKQNSLHCYTQNQVLQILSFRARRVYIPSQKQRIPGKMWERACLR